ncbi:serine O-acetyltransferase [Flavobacterium sp. RS13.1]|uniref:serine O-acetyltransferase n=1 Tax=Flavobacterium sp. RS13.1 TaxID=3400345 RepID=UPI003AAA8335
MTYSEYIQKDKEQYPFLFSKKEWLKKLLFREHEYIIWKYIKLLRKEEYYHAKGNMLFSAYYRRRKNLLGERLGFTIPKNVFGEGLLIWHYGNVVVNAMVKVGKNCILHGNNCIGNNGKEDNKNPVIGNNVDVGVGAIIIGDITIADNVIIAAGAVVTKSILESHVVVAGVPAKIVKHII